MKNFLYVLLLAGFCQGLRGMEIVSEEVSDGEKKQLLAKDYVWRGGNWASFRGSEESPLTVVNSKVEWLSEFKKKSHNYKGTYAAYAQEIIENCNKNIENMAIIIRPTVLTDPGYSFFGCFKHKKELEKIDLFRDDSVFVDKKVTIDDNSANQCNAELVAISKSDGEERNAFYLPTGNIKATKLTTRGKVTLGGMLGFLALAAILKSFLIIAEDAYLF